MRETQQTIAAWALETFGPGTPAASLQRAIEEMGEFGTALVPEHILEEAADIVICLYVLADRLRANLHAEVDRKMAVNRERKWIAHGDGTGHHIKSSDC